MNYILKKHIKISENQNNTSVYLEVLFLVAGWCIWPPAHPAFSIS
jgi:hypothetical protein